MVEGTDFVKIIHDLGVKYVFKVHVNCTLVKIGDKEIWKNGDQGVSGPISLSHDVSSNTIGVLEANKSVYYKKDSTKDTWEYEYAIDRKKPANGAQTTNSSSTSATTPSSGNSGLTGGAPSTIGTDASGMTAAVGTDQTSGVGTGTDRRGSTTSGQSIDLSNTDPTSGGSDGTHTTPLRDSAMTTSTPTAVYSAVTTGEEGSTATTPTYGEEENEVKEEGTDSSTDKSGGLLSGLWSKVRGAKGSKSS